MNSHLTEQQPAYPTTTEYIVLYQGKFPVQFVRNVAGMVFSLCHLSEATEFPSAAKAEDAARKAGINPLNISTSPVLKTKI